MVINDHFKQYINISLLNLILVAVLGILMRYKIGFEFPYFDQKYLQYAHSHFAFTGWITHTLYTFIVYILSKEIPGINVSRYFTIIKINLLCSYGMLISFALQGYDIASIFFSSASILLSFAFAGVFFADTILKKQYFIGHSWFSAALLFAIISSAGTFMLAYIMSAGNVNLDLYISSVYFYLHFQYNGWFFFACMGLFAWKINAIIPDFKVPPVVFKLFAVSCIPAFFLSVLWLQIPLWIYSLVVVAAFSQVIAFAIFIKKINSRLINIKNHTGLFLQVLFLFVGTAVAIKLMLQLFSIFPSISQLAFGFRTIVIAYLHLVLLAFVSVYLLLFMFWEGFITGSKASVTAMIIIISGIFLNELILLIQGISSFSYTLVPFANEGLFAVSAVILLGVLLLLLSNLKKKILQNDKL